MSTPKAKCSLETFENKLVSPIMKQEKYVSNPDLSVVMIDRSDVKNNLKKVASMQSLQHVNKNMRSLSHLRSNLEMKPPNPKLFSKRPKQIAQVQYSNFQAPGNKILNDCGTSKDLHSKLHRKNLPPKISKLGGSSNGLIRNVLPPSIDDKDKVRR